MKVEGEEKNYKPVDLARMFALHPNTIRAYESMGFISKSNRAKNGYRQYTLKHILQLKIVRAVFSYHYTNHEIRQKGLETIKKLAEGDLDLGRQYANEYIQCIEGEIEKAEQTMQILTQWVSNKQSKEVDDTGSRQPFYTRREIAKLVGTTSEAIRNWQRNDLIQADGSGENHEVLFKAIQLERIRIIYMMRQTGYSMSAIYRCMSVYDRKNECGSFEENVDQEKIYEALNLSSEEEILSAGDSWYSELKKVEELASQIPMIIEQLTALKK